MEFVVDEITVKVTKKRMRSLRLTISGRTEVKVSAPYWVNAREIEQFVREKRSWIDKQVAKYTQQIKIEVEPVEESRATLEARLPAIVRRVEARTGLHASQWRIKHMKSCWGVCRPTLGRITINLALAHLDDVFLEYIVTHELLHLLELHHNAHFHGLLDQFYPEWKKVRKELNKFKL